MVAVVCVAGQERYLHLDERLHLHAAPLHAAEEALAGKIRRIVVLQPDLQPLPRLAHQHVFNLAAYRVVFNLEEFEMYMAASCFEVGQHIGEHRIEIRIYAHGVAAEWISAVGPPEQLHQVLVFGWEVRTYAAAMPFRRHFLETVQVFIGNQALPPVVPAEEKVQHQTYSRQADEHHYPGQRPDGMPVLGYDHGHDAEHREQKDDVEPHLPELLFGRIDLRVVACIGDYGGEIYHHQEQQHEESYEVKRM